MALSCKRCLIDGRVQGVFYRASAYKKALEIGLCGWICNRSDGQVETQIQGEPSQLKQMIDWLWQGSSGSHVISVQCYDEEPISADTFKVTCQDNYVRFNT